MTTKISRIIILNNIIEHDPDSKVHGANMGPTWVLSATDGPHVGPMDLAIRGHKAWTTEFKSRMNGVYRTEDIYGCPYFQINYSDFC